jgi:alpha/beta superfamily hydrolase
MQQTAIAFNSGTHTLEGILTRPSRLHGGHPMVVLCHPHPALAGNMEHPLLVALNNTLASGGAGVLRFNFRGVGGSGGTFTNGEAELEDVLSALSVASHWPGVKRGKVGLVGYSFGAGVILRAKEKLKNVKGVALLSPPPASVASSPLLGEKMPKLFMTSDGDKISPPGRLSEMITGAKGITRLEVVPGAGHSWRGQEQVAATKCAEFLTACFA